MCYLFTKCAVVSLNMLNTSIPNLMGEIKEGESSVEKQSKKSYKNIVL